jgi:hypothetical protein
VAEEKLDLLQIAAILTTELRAGPAQIVCTEVLDPNLSCRLLDDRPNGPVAQLITNQLPALGKRRQQAAVLDLGHNHPDSSETLRQIALKAVR